MGAAEAAARIRETLVGKTRGWQGPKHNKPFGTLMQEHLHHVHVVAEDVVAVGAAIPSPTQNTAEQIQGAASWPPKKLVGVLADRMFELLDEYDAATKPATQGKPADVKPPG